MLSNCSSCLSFLSSAFTDDQYDGRADVTSGIFFQLEAIKASLDYCQKIADQEWKENIDQARLLTKYRKAQELRIKIHTADFSELDSDAADILGEDGKLSKKQQEVLNWGKKMFMENWQTELSELEAELLDDSIAQIEGAQS